jgi:hypothetical protein
MDSILLHSRFFFLSLAKSDLNDRIVNDQTEVAETFNEFFVNVGKDIGKDSCDVNQEHPSVKVISEHKYSENKLKFESWSKCR